MDIKSKASGDITQVYVKAGQTVKKGALLAQIDSRNASISLESAKIAYEKLTKIADPEDVQTAEDSVVKAYNDAWNEVTSVFVDYPSVITGMNSLLYSQTGYLSDSKSNQRSVMARANIQKAGVSFDLAKSRYEVVLSEYNSLSRLSATTSLQLLTNDTYDMVKMMSDALKNTQNAISYIMQSEQDTTTPANTAANNVNTWLSSVNSHLSTIFSDQNSIVSSEKTLRDLIRGPDQLDIRSGQLSLLQSQNSYQDYFIRAPFDGVIARVPVKVGDSGSGATIATLIANKKLATISLNEVDVAKVKIGQKASLTFDAVEGLTVPGEVDEVDLIGTVSQGVVSYNVKVIFDIDDARIKPGMSVSADIVTDSKENVLTVPNGAVKTQGNMKYVETLVASSTLKRIPIRTGVSNDTNTEVVSGLNEGDRIIARTITTATTAATQAPSIFNAARPSGTSGAQIRNIGR
ncbi:MAG: efflux RND transporter periplasmic adaptor subunit [Candidatus Taylorbacteria bacterium]|nr:efflux RND transporter periplasmic adaptor subunit [Candidatus Taylorbacteria bacterium]